MSSRTPSEKPFFIGYIDNPPKGIQTFILPVFALFIVGAVFFSLLLSGSQTDPGPAGFKRGVGQLRTSGIVELHPYPVLRIPAGKNGEPARTLMMSGPGKRGVFQWGEKLQGKYADARGAVLARGDIEMLQVGNRNGLKLSKKEVPANFTPAPPKPLGKWRITGEICDGKCVAGVMRPGRGIAHKACANLCVIGGIPAVFVSSGPVNGSTFFLLTDADGNPLGDELYDLMALYIEAEGHVEQLDDLMVFKMELDSVRILR